MPQTQDTVLLREAVAAAKAGNKAQARQLLRQASVHNPNNELVWLWRASLSESPKEATFFLGEVLRVNPSNQKASAWLDRCKGGGAAAGDIGKTTAPPPSSGLAPPGAPAGPAGAAAGLSTSEMGLRQSILRAAENLGGSVRPAEAAPSGVSRPSPSTAGPEAVRAGEPAARTNMYEQPAPAARPAQSFALPPLRTPAPAPASAPTSRNPSGVGVRSPFPSAAADSSRAPAAPAPPPRPADNPFAARTAMHNSASIPAPVQPAAPAKWLCPFCSYGSEASHRRCPNCKAVTVLEELREVEKNDGVVEKSVRDALSRLEAIPADQRHFEHNLHLALGHLNLREATKALPYLKHATAQRRNDWALLGVLDQIQWRKVILVVDDSLTIRKALANFLEKNEFRVVMAEDGRKALERLNEVVPDLVLLDITMPNLDGYQVCKTMKDNALTKSVPVVMLSGKDGIFDKVRGKLAGCADYVTKPFDPEALLKTIRKYVKA